MSDALTHRLTAAPYGVFARMLDGEIHLEYVNTTFLSSTNIACMERNDARAHARSKQQGGESALFKKLNISHGSTPLSF